ncbi:MAG: hypothetical protein JRH01_08555 [Deltaproteobacteria bacterium]|nr:hypothetical protein [Deltaproteobacteria bacterium]MBW2362514.1 hypothetical protein [Deltaproteobacteria bacterium]
MASALTSITAPLGFTRAEHVLADDERPGLLRAKTQPFGRTHKDVLDFRPCRIQDDAAPGAPASELEQAGFEAIDISGHAGLQAALTTIREEDFLSDGTACAVRENVSGARFELAGGKALEIQHVADDGMILRRAGPNGLDVNPGGMDGANGHGGAMGIHGDQDVFGTPLKQMMKGGAPRLFRHQTPDGRNDTSSLFLLNLWIPIQQVTRPLVLMDRRTLDAERHQLRYGLPVTSFLERDEEKSVNDIWTFLPDPGQEWHFRSEMGPEEAYVFDTLGEAHGACVLPGEDALEWLYLELGRGREAVAAGDEAALQALAASEPPALPEVTTEPVRATFRQLAGLLREATLSETWSARVEAARDRVIRKSIEMRMVARLTSA